MAGVADVDGAKVDRDDVEGGLGGAEHGRGHLHHEGVLAVLVDHVGHEARGAGAREGPHDAHRKDLGGHPDDAQHGVEHVHQVVHGARRPKHPDGEEDGDQVWNDGHGDVEALLGALDEHLVDPDALDEAVQGKADEQGRQHEGRQHANDRADGFKHGGRGECVYGGQKGESRITRPGPRCRPCGAGPSPGSTEAGGGLGCRECRRRSSRGSPA